MFIGFQHNKFLVSATNAVIGNRGTGLPASVGNGIVLVGYPMTDLKTAIEIARDLTQMRVQVSRVGTQFGVAPPSIPMPSNISLFNVGWSCPKSSSTCTIFFFFGFNLNFFNGYIGIFLAVSFLVVNNIIITL